MKNKINQEAKEIVESALKASLPKGTPMPYKNFTSAKFIKAKRKTVVAEIELFDGLTAVIEVTTWANIEGAWSYGWINNPGGAFGFSNGKWRRISEEKLLRNGRESL